MHFATILVGLVIYYKDNTLQWWLSNMERTFLRIQCQMVITVPLIKNVPDLYMRVISFDMIKPNIHPINKCFRYVHLNAVNKFYWLWS